MKAVRQNMQIVFQDPLASLDPRMTAGDIIAEPVRNFHPELTGAEVKARVKAMMDQVGLLPAMVNRYPHEFSGGQCQRIGIARAMILGPKLVVATSPSARWMYLFVHRSSTYSWTCSVNTIYPCCLSVTICRWFAISVTA